MPHTALTALYQYAAAVAIASRRLMAGAGGSVDDCSLAMRVRAAAMSGGPIEATLGVTHAHTLRGLPTVAAVCGWRRARVRVRGPRQRPLE
jgi:hypothetical protein